ncbi:hypothetical protein [Flaviaesturariibacter amylovorans]|uniref:hypothetical protein n=1 Tax=Flaviaesturariibacter amylovorans TaxID=1084520 RepID=UPI0031E68083
MPVQEFRSIGEAINFPCLTCDSLIYINLQEDEDAIPVNKLLHEGTFPSKEHLVGIGAVQANIRPEENGHGEVFIFPGAALCKEWRCKGCQKRYLAFFGYPDLQSVTISGTWEVVREPSATLSPGLNADNLVQSMRELFSSKHEFGESDYRRLLHELSTFGITTVAGLKLVLQKQMAGIQHEEQRMLSREHLEVYEKMNGEEWVLERLRHGVWYSFEALVHIALQLEYPDQYRIRRFAEDRYGMYD